MLPRIAAMLLGVWLMAAPAVLGYAGSAATSDRIVAPVVVAVAIIAMSAVMRPLRRVNTLAGAWIAAAPLFLDHSGAATVNALIVGVAVAGLSFAGDADEDEFAGGWSSLWK